MGDARREADRARQEAAAWFTRLSRPAITTGALREFREWRKAPENRQAYEAIESVWSAAGALANDAEVRALAVRKPGSRGGGARGRSWVWAAPVAAAALALALAAFLAWSVRASVYESGVGEMRVVRLDDGSVMRLNTDSRVDVRFGRGERRVRLERGEALFDVAHDERRPFVVTADGAQVRAIGTRFNVRRTGGVVDVVLLEGAVAVRSEAAGEVTLKPNQRVAVSDGEITGVAAVDAPEVASWAEGRLVFEGTPLSQAVAEVNRYSRRKVQLAEPGLGGAEVSGTFRTGDSAAFAAAVAEIFDLQLEDGRAGAMVLQRRSGVGS